MLLYSVFLLILAGPYVCGAPIKPFVPNSSTDSNSSDFEFRFTCVSEDDFCAQAKKALKQAGEYVSSKFIFTRSIIVEADIAFEEGHDPEDLGYASATLHKALTLNSDGVTYMFPSSLLKQSKLGLEVLGEEADKPDINIHFNPDAAKWWFQGRPRGNNIYDFRRIAIHEILHGLGFGTSNVMSEAVESKYLVPSLTFITRTKNEIVTNMVTNSYPNIWDRYIKFNDEKSTIGDAMSYYAEISKELNRNLTLNKDAMKNKITGNQNTRTLSSQVYRFSTTPDKVYFEALSKKQYMLDTSFETFITGRSLSHLKSDEDSPDFLMAYASNPEILEEASERARIDKSGIGPGILDIMETIGYTLKDGSKSQKSLDEIATKAKNAIPQKDRALPSINSGHVIAQTGQSNQLPTDDGNTSNGQSSPSSGQVNDLSDKANEILNNQGSHSRDNNFNPTPTKLPSTSKRSGKSAPAAPRPPLARVPDTTTLSGGARPSVSTGQDNATPTTEKSDASKQNALVNKAGSSQNNQDSSSSGQADALLDKDNEIPNNQSQDSQLQNSRLPNPQNTATFSRTAAPSQTTLPSSQNSNGGIAKDTQSLIPSSLVDPGTVSLSPAPQGIAAPASNNEIFDALRNAAAGSLGQHPSIPGSNSKPQKDQTNTRSTRQGNAASDTDGSDASKQNDPVNQARSLQDDQDFSSSNQVQPGQVSSSPTPRDKAAPVPNNQANNAAQEQEPGNAGSNSQGSLTPERASAKPESQVALGSDQATDTLNDKAIPVTSSIANRPSDQDSSTSGSAAPASDQATDTSNSQGQTGSSQGIPGQLVGAASDFNNLLKQATGQGDKPSGSEQNSDGQSADSSS